MYIYIHTHVCDGILFSSKNEILIHAITRMNIMLNEINQTQRNTL